MTEGKPDPAPYRHPDPLDALNLGLPLVRKLAAVHEAPQGELDFTGRIPSAAYLSESPRKS